MTDKLRAAILVVSTTASKHPGTDTSSSVLRDVFEKEASVGGVRRKWEVVDTKIVSDDTKQIQAQVKSWADNKDSNDQGFPNLIITTGGTGFAVSDTTPEAVLPLLHKHASGLVHAMMSASLNVTPFAMMSRPVAGVRNKSIIVTLPGSPKGAQENLEAIIKTIAHACLQAAGVDSRALHSGGVKKLEAEAGINVGAGVGEESAEDRHHYAHLHEQRVGGGGCGHYHSYGHSHGHRSLVQHTSHSNDDAHPLSNDPKLGASRRYRKSPFPMVSVADALFLIKKHTPPPTIMTANVDPDLVGAVLAADVSASENVPAFRASIVDGYAVVVPEDGDLRGTFPVVSIFHAAPAADNKEDAKHNTVQLKLGEIARITTGAPMPPGATSVIMVEDTILRETTENGMEEKLVEILAKDVKQGENIREAGSDVVSGSIILRKGEAITAVGGELGLLASIGVSQLPVYRRPVVGVLSTGDELVEANSLLPLRYGQVRDSNRPTLLAAVRAAGFRAIDLGIAKDKAEALEITLRDALRDVDVLVTTGGVSMGELDLLKPTVERCLGGTIHFGRVAMKPGKPTTFATVHIKDVDARSARVIFSLPGNPASALVTFNLFVLPALHHASGVEPAGCSRIPVVLGHDFSLDPFRTEYHRAVLAYEAEPGSDIMTGTLVARSTGNQRSSIVGSMKSANALLEMPPETEVKRDSEGRRILRKGARVTALLVAGL